MSWHDGILLSHTLVLGLSVVALATVIGVALAFQTERAVVPGRRVWRVLLVMPLAMPDFIVGFTWHSLLPTLNGYIGALSVMTLGTYPLVYLPAAAALRRVDPSLLEAAQSLGASRTRIVARVILPLMATAIAGGAVLVFLTTISEYGAFEVLRYQTLTTEIFSQFQFDPSDAAMLSVPLLLLGVLALVVETRFVRRQVASFGVGHRPARGGNRWLAHPRPHRWFRLTAMAALVALGVGLPISTLGYWLAQGSDSTLTASTSVGAASLTTGLYSGAAAVVGVAIALALVLATRRRGTSALRAVYLLRAVPGLVVAILLVGLASHFLLPLYQSSTLLVAAYAILHLPLAVVAVRASAAQAPVALSDLGRSLGANRLRVLTRITLPLLAPGLLAGLALVFLSAVTELTATLVLAPIGVQTLATQFWAFQAQVAYGSASPYALAILALAIPGGLFIALRSEVTTP